MPSKPPSVLHGREPSIFGRVYDHAPPKISLGAVMNEYLRLLHSGPPLTTCSMHFCGAPVNTMDEHSRGVPPASVPTGGACEKNRPDAQQEEQQILLLPASAMDW